MKVLGPVLNWVVFLLLNFKVICVFCVTVLYPVCLLQIFLFQAVARLSVLSTLPYMEQKLSTLTKSSLSVVYFVGRVLVLWCIFLF